MSYRPIRMLLTAIATVTLTLLVSIASCLAVPINRVYDDANRLTRIEYDDGKVISYEYDDAGNRTEKKVEQKIAITSSAGSNGSIDFAGVCIVEPGVSRTYVFTPNQGYGVADVIIDGVSIGGASSYTFTPEQLTALQNHTIEVQFSNIYITATAGPHGNIYPFGDVYVMPNGDKMFTMTPLSEAYVSDVVVDGTTHLGGVSTHQFTNVTANHTIAASFALYPVRVVGVSTTYYPTLQDAYNAAAASGGNVIQCQEMTLIGSLNVNGTNAVTIEGGYNADFTSNTDRMTSLQGQLQTYAGAGTVTIKNFTITQ